MRIEKPNWTAACIHDTATLLPSPTQATVLPLIDPRCSSKVMISAITWQGWLLSVNPLMTGTLACSASASSVSWELARIMIASI